MLVASPTRDLQSIRIWGDAWDLQEAKDFIHRVCDDKNPMGNDAEELCLALASDLRKAGEDRHHKRTATFFEDDKKAIYGADVSVPLLALQLALLRRMLAFRQSTTRDQAVMFTLEAIYEDAVRAGFPESADRIIDLSRNLTLTAEVYDRIESRMDVYSNLDGTKARRAFLPSVLMSLSPLYDAIYAMHSQNGTCPDPLIPPEAF
jgi:hypothetical protein